MAYISSVCRNIKDLLVEHAFDFELMAGNLLSEQYTYFNKLLLKPTRAGHGTHWEEIYKFIETEEKEGNVLGSLVAVIAAQLFGFGIVNTVFVETYRCFTNLNEEGKTTLQRLLDNPVAEAMKVHWELTKFQLDEEFREANFPRLREMYFCRGCLTAQTFPEEWRRLMKSLISSHHHAEIDAISTPCIGQILDRDSEWMEVYSSELDNYIKGFVDSFPDLWARIATLYHVKRTSIYTITERTRKLFNGAETKTAIILCGPEGLKYLDESSLPTIIPYEIREKIATLPNLQCSNSPLNKQRGGPIKNHGTTPTESRHPKSTSKVNNTCKNANDSTTSEDEESSNPNERMNKSKYPTGRKETDGTTSEDCVKNSLEQVQSRILNHVYTSSKQYTAIIKTWKTLEFKEVVEHKVVRETSPFSLDTFWRIAERVRTADETQKRIYKVHQWISDFLSTIVSIIQKEEDVSVNISNAMSSSRGWNKNTRNEERQRVESQIEAAYMVITIFSRILGSALIHRQQKANFMLVVLSGMI